jgi:hypothetical protein
MAVGEFDLCPAEPPGRLQGGPERTLIVGEAAKGRKLRFPLGRRAASLQRRDGERRADQPDHDVAPFELKRFPLMSCFPRRVGSRPPPLRIRFGPAISGSFAQPIRNRASSGESPVWLLTATLAISLRVNRPIARPSIKAPARGSTNRRPGEMQSPQAWFEEIQRARPCQLRRASGI